MVNDTTLDYLLSYDWNQKIDEKEKIHTALSQDIAKLEGVSTFEPVAYDWLPLMTYLLCDFYNQDIRAKIIYDYPVYLHGQVDTCERIIMSINRLDLKDQPFDLLSTESFSLPSYVFDPILHGCVNPNPYFNGYEWQIIHRATQHSVRLFIRLYTRDEQWPELDFMRGQLMDYGNMRQRCTSAIGNNHVMIGDHSSCHYLEDAPPFRYTELPWMDTFKPVNQEWFHLAFYLVDTLYTNQIQGGIFGDYPAFVAGRLKDCQDIHVYVNRKDWKELLLFSTTAFATMFYSFKPIVHPYLEAFSDIFTLYTWKVTNQGHPKKTIRVHLLLSAPVKADVSLLEFIKHKWEAADFPCSRYAIVGAPYCLCLKDVQTQDGLKEDYCPIEMTQRLQKVQQKYGFTVSDQEGQDPQTSHTHSLLQY